MDGPNSVWRRPSVIGGIAGLTGGLLVPISAFFGAEGALLVGIFLVVVSELALVVLLLRVSRIAAGFACLALGIGVVIVGIGTQAWLERPFLVATGVFCWAVVAVIAAVVVARAHLISIWPALALLVVSTIWIVLSPTAIARPDSPAYGAVVAALVSGYCLSWSWLGFAMLRSEFSPHR